MALEDARTIEQTRQLLERRGMLHADGSWCQEGHCWDLVGVSLRFRGLRTYPETYCPCQAGQALARAEAARRNELARSNESRGVGTPQRYRWFVTRSPEMRTL